MQRNGDKVKQMGKSKLEALKEGNIIGKTAGVAWWLLFGKLDAEQKAKLVGALAYMAREGKNALQHVEVGFTKDGLTIRYKSEF